MLNLQASRSDWFGDIHNKLPPHQQHTERLQCPKKSFITHIDGHFAYDRKAISDICVTCSDGTKIQSEWPNASSFRDRTPFAYFSDSGFSFIQGKFEEYDDGQNRWFSRKPFQLTGIRPELDHISSTAYLAAASTPVSTEHTRNWKYQCSHPDLRITGLHVQSTTDYIGQICIQCGDLEPDLSSSYSSIGNDEHTEEEKKNDKKSSSSSSSSSEPPSNSSTLAAPVLNSSKEDDELSIDREREQAWLPIQNWNWMLQQVLTVEFIIVCIICVVLMFQLLFSTKRNMWSRIKDWLW